MSAPHPLSLAAVIALVAVALFVGSATSTSAASLKPVGIKIILARPDVQLLVGVLVKGCSRAAAELRGTITCDGPVLAASDGAAEINAAINAHVPGIAILPPGIMTPSLDTALRNAQAAGVPVITFLRDLPAPQSHLRVGFLGNPATALGGLLAKLAWQFAKNGGTYCVSYVPSDPDQAAWYSSVVSGLSIAPPASAGSHWLEAAECSPLVTNTDPVLATSQLRDVMIGAPWVNLVIVLNGIPQEDVSAYRAAMNSLSKDIVANKLAVFAMGDEHKQLDLLEDTSTAQIGFRTTHYGYRIVQAIKAISEGGSTSGLFDPIGYDVCRRDNAFECNGVVTGLP